MGKRRQAREYCLQALYLSDIGKCSSGDIKTSLEYNGNPPEGDALAFANSLIEGTLTNISKIDSYIQEFAQNWKLERMSSVDRAILRMACYELLFLPETPMAAVMDEAIELGKKYSTDNSGRFINGILDRIKTKRPAAQ